MDLWIIFSIVIILIFVSVLCFCIYMLLVSIGCFARKVFKDALSTNNYKSGAILSLGEQTASAKLDEIELLDVSMKLRYDEACYFEGEGFSYHTKEVVVGYKRSSYGKSIRVMRGYSIHRSNSKSDVIRKTVETAYQGRLFITNERIVFLAERYGFDIGFENLSNITIYNGYLEVFAGSKFYRVYTPHSIFIRDLITLMNICHDEQKYEDVHTSLVAKNVNL
ncbi:MAG: hypothetical protein J6Q89_03150 [Clostridia bacterium]|nr:hypothetical protein [Clostridia bacterium]